jgi:NAD(P)-dependent dehydrogenase (short-subunit alcohol dehydrogenase family)
LKTVPETTRDIPDYTQCSRLDGQGFVILGAGQGMGLQSSHALAQSGARLLCVDNDEGRANAIAAAVGGDPMVADVTSRASMEQVFARADALFGENFGGLVDIIGMAHPGGIEGITDEEWSSTHDIIVRHAIYAMQLAAPLLRKAGGGAMTFIGSISGNVVSADSAVYSACKAALHHLIRLASVEFGRSGIRVNGIAPGLVRTPRLDAAMPADIWGRYGEANWLGRAANPSDIARAVLFLSSDLARYVNGNILTLDGGISHGAASIALR